MSEKKLAGEIVYGLIQAVKNVFSMSGPCRFEPSCSVYAAEAICRLSWHRAIILTAWRVVRCNPLCRGGYDPVPEK